MNSDAPCLCRCSYELNDLPSGGVKETEINKNIVIIIIKIVILILFISKVFFCLLIYLCSNQTVQLRQQMLLTIVLKCQYKK